MSDRTVTEERPATAQMKTRLPLLTFLNVLSILLVVISVVLFAIYPIIQHQLLRLLITYLSHDHNITPEGIREITCAFYFMTVLMFALGLGLRDLQNPGRRSRIRSAFGSESICYSVPIRPSPKSVFLVTTLSGIFLTIVINLFDVHTRVFRILFLEDGVFESLTPLLMVISAALLLRAASAVRSNRRLPTSRVWVTVFFALTAIVCILYAGEEVSWGQRIFGWSTPAIFAGNTQHETNIHNFYNSSFPLIYRSLVVLPFFMLPSLMLELRKQRSRLAKLVFPHISLIGLGCLIAFVSQVWFQQEELLEELVSIFVLFYSLRAHACSYALKSRSVSPVLVDEREAVLVST